MGRLVLLLLLGAACASTSSSSAKDEPVTQQKEQAAASEEELASAFEPEQEKPKAQPQRPPDIVQVDYAAGFKTALSEGQSALKSKQLDAARDAAARAMKEAQVLDGEARNQAGQLAFKVALAAGDPAIAADAADAWRLACGPEKADSCRSAAIAGLGSVAKMKGADKKIAKQQREWQDAEVCAAKTQGASKPQPCEPTSLHLAKKSDDDYLAQRIALGQALREETDTKQVFLLEKAEEKCTKPQCAAMRRKALGKLISLARAKNDVDGAAKYALREVGVIMAALPEENKAWARTGMLDQTCVSYDTAHTPGSCRALEKKTLGRWTFHDYSKEQAGQGLSADQVRSVNEHFAPLLQECLAEQAKRMTPPDAQRFEVRWVVFNDGRVGEVHMKKEHDQSQLAKCLRAQFNGWRYPKYEGEYQNVEQSFTVTAVVR
jgi:hypothetical protein